MSFRIFLVGTFVSVNENWNFRNRISQAMNFIGLSSFNSFSHSIYEYFWDENLRTFINAARTKLNTCTLFLSRFKSLRFRMFFLSFPYYHNITFVDLHKQTSYSIYEFFATLLIHTVRSPTFDFLKENTWGMRDAKGVEGRGSKSTSVFEYHEIEKKYEQYFSEYEIHSNKLRMTDTN